MISKRVQHWYWKAGNIGTNCLVAAGFLLFFSSCLVAGSFGFWLQVKLAEFLFG